MQAAHGQAGTTRLERAKAQVGVPDDARTDLGLAVAAGRAHRRHAVDELGLTDRTHLLRPAESPAAEELLISRAVPVSFAPLSA